MVTQLLALFIFDFYNYFIKKSQVLALKLTNFLHFKNIEISDK